MSLAFRSTGLSYGESGSPCLKEDYSPLRPSSHLHKMPRSRQNLPGTTGYAEKFQIPFPALGWGDECSPRPLYSGVSFLPCQAFLSCCRALPIVSLFLATIPPPQPGTESGSPPPAVSRPPSGLLHPQVPQACPTTPRIL